MWQFALPALQAIGINAGVNLLRRKPIFENAATAGVTGGVLGGFNGGGGLFSSNPNSSPLSVGGVSNGAVTNALAGGDVGKGLAMNASMLGGSNALAGVPGTGAFEASMGLNNAYNAGSLAGLPGSGTIESVLGQAGADGVYRDAGSFANVFGMPTYTGGEGLLSNAIGNIGDKFSGLGDSLTPQNLIGVSSLLSNMNEMPRPVSSSGGGGMQGGTPPKFEPFKTGQVYTRKKRG